MGVCEILTIVFMVVGVFFALVGVVGVLKFKDFYARAQAATSISTLGQIGAMLACVVACVGAGLSAMWIVKLVLIMVFVMFTSAVSGHALSKANYLRGNRPEGGFAKDDYGKDGF